jgi:signal peptidase I
MRVNIEKEIIPMKGFLRELFITLGLALVIYLLLQVTIQSSIVNNVSMQPGLVAGERLIIVKLLYHFKSPERGDVIVIHPPIDPQREYIKRLIGLPGDIVQVSNGSVYINGIPLSEPYIKDSPRYIYGPFRVPENNYFVLGDNRNESNDSHTGWTVTGEEIVGKAWLRIWPFNKWGSAGSYPLNEQVAGHKALLMAFPH